MTWCARSSNPVFAEGVGGSQRLRAWLLDAVTQAKASPLRLVRKAVNDATQTDESTREASRVVLSVSQPRFQIRYMTDQPAFLISQDTVGLGIGNGVGKQGRGNRPPYRRYGPDTEIQYRLRKPRGPAKRSRILSKREADTEFQYRPYIVDTDAIADALFADAISETSSWNTVIKIPFRIVTCCDPHCLVQCPNSRISRKVIGDEQVVVFG